MFDSKWNKRFVELAEHVAQWSQDPSTKVGAVIVRPDKSLVSVGFNGFPRGVTDENLGDRDYKLARTTHAELNAILSAKTSVEGCAVYVTLCPCSHCAAAIIQAGIKEVYYKPTPKHLMDRWGSSFDTTFEMFNQSDVLYYEVG